MNKVDSYLKGHECKIGDIVLNGCGCLLKIISTRDGSELQLIKQSEQCKYRNINSNGQFFITGEYRILTKQDKLELL